MRRRSPLLFIALNVIVTALVAVVAISLFGGQPQAAPVQVITVEVRITNTPDPNVTPLVRIITATPLPGQVAAVLPTGIIETLPGGPTTPLPTINAAALGASAGLQGTATALPPNCILHVIEAGDTPFGVAQRYGADGFAVMTVNGLDDQSAARLQIGDALIVPLEGCPLTAADVAAPAPAEEEATAEVTAEATAEITAVATQRPTPTLPPTAANAQVQIIEVVGVGDVTAEGVVIRNVGNTVNMRNWTLSDADGSTYTFGEQVLFSNAQVTVFTRVGTNTPIALFWNRSTAVLAPGDVLTLRDANGAVQSSFRVPAPVNLP